jgi:hypothetical protein
LGNLVAHRNDPIGHVPVEAVRDQRNASAEPWVNRSQQTSADEELKAQPGAGVHPFFITELPVKVNASKRRVAFWPDPRSENRQSTGRS